MPWVSNTMASLLGWGDTSLHVSVCEGHNIKCPAPLEIPKRENLQLPFELSGVHYIKFRVTDTLINNSFMR